MSRKTRRYCIIAAAILGIIIVVGAIAAVFSSNTGSDESQEPVEETVATENTPDEGDTDSNTSSAAGEWLEKSNDATQQLASVLCKNDWKTLKNSLVVSFELDGTYSLSSDSSQNDKEGTWKITDVSIGKESTGTTTYQNTTAVLTVDDIPYSFNLDKATTYLNGDSNKKVTYTLASNAFSNGESLANAEKDNGFSIFNFPDSDTDNKTLTSPYMVLSFFPPSDTSWKGTITDFCAEKVPLASSCTWNRDLDIDYEKGTAITSFTCNNSKETKLYLKTWIDSESYTVSTSNS